MHEDLGCLSWIPDPDFCPSRIQKQQQKIEVKKILFFVAVLLHRDQHFIERESYPAEEREL
jgi:hypothetical protein